MWIEVGKYLIETIEKSHTQQFMLCGNSSFFLVQSNFSRDKSDEMSKTLCSSSFALGSANGNFDVSTPTPPQPMGFSGDFRKTIALKIDQL